MNLEIPCTWQELEQLAHGPSTSRKTLRARAIEILGKERGLMVLRELDAGRTPLFAPQCGQSRPPSTPRPAAMTASTTDK